MQTNYRQKKVQCLLYSPNGAKINQQSQLYVLNIGRNACELILGFGIGWFLLKCTLEAIVHLSPVVFMYTGFYLLTFNLFNKLF